MRLVRRLLRMRPRAILYLGVATVRSLRVHILVELCGARTRRCRDSVVVLGSASVRVEVCETSSAPCQGSCMFQLLTPCHQASRQSSDVLTKPKVYPEWFTLPLAPYARRRTLLQEIVPGQA